MNYEIDLNLVIADQRNFVDEMNVSEQRLFTVYIVFRINKISGLIFRAFS